MISLNLKFVLLISFGLYLRFDLVNLIDEIDDLVEDFVLSDLKRVHVIPNSVEMANRLDLVL